MNKRRQLVLVLSGMALAVPLVAVAQRQPAKIPRVGFIGTTSPSTNPHVTQGFQRGLRDLGYVEGQNIVVEYRSFERKTDRLPGLLSELIHLNVDVIVVSAGDAAVAAKRMTTSIPIVFIAINNPVEQGLVASLARPGGNVTGTTVFHLTAKRLELAKEILPKRFPIAFLQSGDSILRTKEMETAAKSLGIQIQTLNVRSAADLEPVFASIAGTRALILPGVGFEYLHRTRIAELGAKYRVPLIGAYQEIAELGALMTYDVDRIAVFRRGAAYVGKILKGANPGDLPVEEPTKFELVINLKTAKALGITIPQSILLRADRVIE